MGNNQIITLLQEQLREYVQRDNRQRATIRQQEETIARLSGKVEELTLAVNTLNRAVSKKEETLDKALREVRSLAKCISSKSEKRTPPDTEKKQQENPEGTSPSSSVSAAKKRGNNNAKRMEHFGIEVMEHDVYPEEEGFDRQLAKYIKAKDSIRYEFIPPRFIKHIYHLHYYRRGGTVVCGKAPLAPGSGSNYDASFTAGMLQLRYGFNLPVERIIKYFHQNGFAIKKSTAHELIGKSSLMLETMGEVLKETILEQDYLHMDETYATILEEGAKSQTGKSSCKGYIFGAIPEHLKLIHYFYDNGSRGRKVLTDYLPPTYTGAVQSDGYVIYKILETDAYPGVIRLGCIQHCKRKFLDIDNNDARKVVDLINRLYRMEHKIPPDAPHEVRLKCKQTEGVRIFARLEKELLRIKEQELLRPKGELAGAVEYALSELPAMCNYLERWDYRLDNNIIERENRSIALMRKNSLFFGSHNGAKRGLLLQSLISSCKLNEVNPFEYITDLLNRFVKLPPNTDHAVLRELLPDRWKKKET